MKSVINDIFRKSEKQSEILHLDSDDPVLTPQEYVFVQYMGYGAEMSLGGLHFDGQIFFNPKGKEYNVKAKYIIHG